MELQRDEVGDGAPPRTRVDLANGTAHVVLPSPDGASGPRPAAGRPSDVEEDPSRWRRADPVSPPGPGSDPRPCARNGLLGGPARASVPVSS
ncbi:DUF6191 domain-containing protein [Streptomyces sp. NPDC007905]|uniref:DUF6191 domain-containing protein n=1 Tax=Streptomyces sp. NPDC007905 TaxID=3364788 RepID=UPI0036EC957B